MKGYNVKEEIDKEFDKLYDGYMNDGRHTCDTLEDDPHKEIYGSGFADGIRCATHIIDDVIGYIQTNDIDEPHLMLHCLNKIIKELNNSLVYKQD